MTPSGSAEAPATRASSGRGHGASNVCIVDDDPSLLRALRRLVSAAGFPAVAFTSAESFLCWEQRAGCRCLVLDVHLGGLNGFELHERLVAEGARVPVIFMTANDDVATRERARAAGAAAYLPKPFDDQLLLDAIRRVA
jgi:FixJ family two-component response regulator